MANILDCEVLRNQEIRPGIFLTRFFSPQIAQASRPGQFINIRTSESFIPLLRKPFSICRRNIPQGWFEIVYRVVGLGTRLLSELKPGEKRNIIGPLGKGFWWDSSKIQVSVLVAGGLGVAPFPILAEHLHQQNIDLHIFLGARTKEELWGEEILRSFSSNLYFSTEDGSLGYQGNVTGLLEQFLTQHDFPTKQSQIFSCGPEPMLRRMVEIGRQKGVPTQISVETLMGCGFGICMGCPMPMRKDRPSASYKLSCIDGPVFDVEEVDVAWQI